MPRRAPRYCTKPGCRQWAEREGRCGDHSLSRSGDHAASTADRGLGSRWRAVAARAIADQPWCLDCGLVGDPRTGRTDEPGNPLTGDHVASRSAFPERSLDPANVAVRCKRCNARKGAKGERAGRIPGGRGP